MGKGKILEGGFSGLSNVFGVDTKTQCPVRNGVEKKVVQTEESATYKVIAKKNRVFINSSKANINFVKETVLENGELIAEHWHEGKMLDGGMFLNIFFYGMSEVNLGKKIVTNVDVIEKTLPDGRIFIMINAYLVPNAAPEYDFKLPINTNVAGAIKIGNSSTQSIEFRERPVYVKPEA